MDKIKRLSELVDLFEFNINQYRGKSYDEAKVRADFIDKFFHLLEWDVYNEQGYSEKYREVVREDRVTIKGKVKAPDYSFRIGGQRKFFVEAKKPAVDIKNEIDPAFQLRRYAYTAKLDLSILTDFEEFAVYDSGIKPNKTDPASTARIFYCTYKEYHHHLQFLYDTFSRPAILKGKFDEYVKTNALKKGTSPVDKEFLKLIENWRESLAKNIALRNKELSIYELNYVVQVIIDRIIFLRIAEDRQMEDYARIRQLAETGNPIYPGLVKLFTLAEQKYDSGLFDFKKDRVSPNLLVDDKVLKDIIGGLYYPDSPYEFSVLDVEILGNIYEQFLGKTIRLTAGHQAKVEDKPEVKKAGGVYYTPHFIVDYIVEQTVGEKIDGKTPEEITTLKILDPACGSGSFLLGAYQVLLDNHLKYYTGVRILGDDPEAVKQRAILAKAIKENRVYQTGEKEYRLTIEEKQKILLNNIFGVDIDRQAVEVTRLSLLLKLLEGESGESAGKLFKYSELKLLPDLSENIKCGNSLIGSDFYDKGQMELFQDEETVRRINVFDWEKEFAGVFQQGGFDVVIGNPPYIRIQGLQEFQPEAIDYLRDKYISSTEGNIDIYVIFLEKALHLLNKSGISGYILPHKFFQAAMGRKIRELIAEKKAIRQIVNFSANQVFETVTTYTCLFFMSGSPQKFFLYNKFDFEVDVREKLTGVFKLEEIDINECTNYEWNFYTGKKGSLLSKLLKMPIKLSDITRKIFVGLQTSADQVFILKRLNYEKEDGDKIRVYSKSLDVEIEIEKDFIKPLLTGKDSKRYEPPIFKNYIIFPYNLKNEPPGLMSEDFIQSHFPLGWNYLYKNKSYLEGREKGRFKKTWWQFGRPQNLSEFETIKIIFPEISLGCNMTFSDAGIYSNTQIYSLIPKEIIKEHVYYWLGVLNSKILWWFLSNTGNVLRGGYFRFKTNYLNPFPIKVIDFNNQFEKAKHDRVVEMVDQMLELQKKCHSARIDTEKTLFKKQIEILDHQIDQLVYDLYGLTDEEIAIVEGELKK